jgi:hypothetical protein
VSSRETGPQGPGELAFNNTSGKEKRGRAVFFERKTMSKQIREAVNDMTPFAFAVRLGHNAVILIGEGLFDLDNEKGDEKCGDD